ncbi:GGDEF domain-containing protein [Euzebya tangerina]|uniref:GGDEF domain-containing protein n=1 Tax=Euzebya tangerina TaxID=591198 RepID=UPI000E30EE41|nr:GGDEF domain-containing protein [Euzebya tangerina]
MPMILREMGNERIEYDQEFWLRHVRVGAWLSLGVILIGLAYLATTPDEPNRLMMLLGLGLGAALTVVVFFTPWRRLIATRAWLAGFYAWSASVLALLGWLAWLDGGVRSPMMPTAVLALIFAAMAYPPAGVLFVSAGAILAPVIVGIASGDDLGSIIFVTGVMAMVAAMSALVSTNHRRSYADVVTLTAKLEFLALKDGLTGCANHRGFHEQLRRMTSLARRNGSELALVLIDLDHFKRVNDTHGHPVGDRLLMAVGETLRATVRESDVVARIGGEEFVILGPDTGREGALHLAARVHAAIQAIDEPVTVTASVGVSLLPELTDDPDELLSQADAAMYQAKQGGRDQIRVAGTDRGTPALVVP